MIALQMFRSRCPAILVAKLVAISNDNIKTNKGNHRGDKPNTTAQYKIATTIGYP
jgi:hypothetical protein